MNDEQPVDCPKALDDAFSEIWKGLETIQHKLHDKYHFDLSAIKKATADTYALCRPFWDKMQESPIKRESVTPEDLQEVLRERFHMQGLNGLNLANDLLYVYEIRRRNTDIEGGKP